ncbi:hypothetical protein U1Q18_051137, partial [Sarracenia purpurea var. burkii]
MKPTEKLTNGRQMERRGDEERIGEYVMAGDGIFEEATQQAYGIEAKVWAMVWDTTEPSITTLEIKQVTETNGKVIRVQIWLQPEVNARMKGLNKKVTDMAKSLQ